jgi:Putative restriction endonuclease
MEAWVIDVDYLCPSVDNPYVSARTHDRLVVRHVRAFRPASIQFDQGKANHERNVGSTTRNVSTTWHGGHHGRRRVRASSLETVFQETPPALVVEVASPRTRLYDRNRKKDVYQGFGISAYWIVEPDRDRPELTVFELRQGFYKQTAHVTGDEEYRAVLPFPVTIAPSQLVTLG